MSRPKLPETPPPPRTRGGAISENPAPLAPPTAPPLDPRSSPAAPTASNARLPKHRYEVDLALKQRYREAKTMMLSAIEDHKSDITGTDKRFTKRVKEAILGKNVSHHKIDLAVKGAKGVWEGTKSLLASVIPGIDLAGSVVEKIGAIGNAYFTGRVRKGQSVSSTAASVFNVDLNTQMLEQISKIQNHGESLALWTGVFKEFSENGVHDRNDLKKFYKAYKKLDVHVRQCETDFAEMNRIFQSFYDQSRVYVEAYRGRKDEIEEKLATLFGSTLLNPMTHWQCKRDKERDPEVECFIDFDMDTFFGMFPLALTAEVFQHARQQLRHVEPVARGAFLDTSIAGPVGILGGTYLSVASMESLKRNPTQHNLHMSVGPAGMLLDAWKSVSKVGFSLSGGFNSRGTETVAVDKAVDYYGLVTNLSVDRNPLVALAGDPRGGKAAALKDLTVRGGALTTVQTAISQYLLAKSSKSSDRRFFIELLKRLVECEAAAIRTAQFELARIV